MKMMSKGLYAAAVLIGALAAMPASAALNVPVPANATITFNNLQWAWASPLPNNGSLLSFQGELGWRLPTAAELAAAPMASDFLFAGANVPFNGTDPVSGAQFSVTNADYASARSAGACASAYFVSGYTHCDWQDGNGQPFAPWAGSAGATGFADQLAVRAIAAVPEPATWAMMFLGFGMMGASMRHRRKSTAVSFA